jgi:integrase/recombinase XerD
MSSIKKTKKGGYQADVRDKDGKRLRMTFNKKSEADAFCTKIEYEKHQLKLIGAGLIKKRIDFNSAIKTAIEEKSSLAPKTYSKYKNVYQILENFAVQKEITTLNEFTIRIADEYKRVLTSSDASPKTVNFYLNAAKSLFKEYVLRNEIPFNPFDHIRLQRVKKKTLLERENDYFSAEEINAFFAQPMLEIYRNAFVSLFCTGMRFSELSNLTWERIDLENKIIEIRTNGDFRTKTLSSERNIPMSNKLYKVIKKLEKKSKFVFPSVKGGKMSEKTLLDICKNVAEKARIDKNATLHKWRHTFNSHLAQLGVDYSIRQYLMGHKPQTMTDHYTKIDPSKLHQQISLLDKLLP